MAVARYIACRGRLDRGLRAPSGPASDTSERSAVTGQIAHGGLPMLSAGPEQSPSDRPRQPSDGAARPEGPVGVGAPGEPAPVADARNLVAFQQFGSVGEVADQKQRRTGPAPDQQRDRAAGVTGVASNTSEPSPVTSSDSVRGARTGSRAGSRLIWCHFAPGTWMWLRRKPRGSGRAWTAAPIPRRRPAGQRPSAWRSRRCDLRANASLWRPGPGPTERTGPASAQN